MSQRDKKELEALLRGSSRRQLARALARMLWEEERERRRAEAQRKLERDR